MFGCLAIMFSLLDRLLHFLPFPDRSVAAPFAYRGRDRALFNDGFAMRTDRRHTVAERFASLSGEQQIRSFCFLQNAYGGELLRLFDQYGSDKGSLDPHDPIANPFPWQPHTYAQLYEMLFRPIRSSVRYVFECGLGTAVVGAPASMGARARPGASLRAWRDYFPNAEILGADIDCGTLFAEERIRTAYVDQTSPDAIRQMWEQFGLGGELDIIIDDGLHNFQAGSTLFRHSFERLREGGLYIIEDVTPNFLGDFDRLFTELGLPYQVFATPRGNQMGDNIILLIIR